MIDMLISVAASPSMLPPADRPILLDSRCTAAEYRPAAKLHAGNGVTLNAMQDDEYIYLCVALPPKSLGALDLYLRVSPGGAITNLHVSAQLGERTYREGEDPPWQWRNHRDWFGTVVPFKGVVVEEGKAYGDFDYSEGRELQLSKTRFSKGRWQMRLHVYDVAGSNGETVAFPAESDSWLDIIVN